MLAGAAFAAAGQLCLLATTPTTGYPWLLPNLLGVGIGVGMFTAPVVATAVRAVPPERSGLASGVNNTARQTVRHWASQPTAPSPVARRPHTTSSPPCAV